MAHRGRSRGKPRKAGQRTPSGQFSRADRLIADINPYRDRHRIETVDAALSSQMLLICCRPADAWSREERDIMLSSASTARDPDLAYLPGIALKRGLFQFLDAEGRSHDGRELRQAADIYAGLHRQVWGRLTDDIEQALNSYYGPGAFELLLEVGRVNAPAPPATHFRQLVSGTPAGTSQAELVPEEYERRRLRLADRYGQARAELAKARPRAVAIVENVVIWAIEPDFMRLGATPTARSQDDQQIFVAGLKRLAEHFGLFDPRAKTRPRRVYPLAIAAE